ncbi:Uroporphyrinogen decarboxylase [Sporomusa silvacetica DSM 10669]|uniref:Uroporphyrinogen decarboxylase n=1 Tax=Sporomusa silvacetica DSM 10669 TaxID=1123289 RepID=A0ABZ3INE9_9FIRM|nr:uroporphyrinogen decarboxylase family protein [Sporomusa silvacetica]OZC14739.1 uroporphyrinogen decarboxylase [Sporomusa silvacetica DSM 10669]
MKTTQELFQERTERVMKTIALEKTDRTPVIQLFDAFAAPHMGVTMKEYCTSFKRANELMLDSLKAFGDLDGTNVSFGAGQLFPLIYMSKVKLPGRELPDDAVWQVDEQEQMTREDYDTILNKGWTPFMLDYLGNRLGIDLENLFGQLAGAPQLAKNIEAAGYMVYTPVLNSSVPEFLGGGRSMSSFIKDLYKMPDKVEAVLDIIQKETGDAVRAQIRATGAKAVFVSPARGASEFWSRKLWERFVWKYIKAMADVVIEEGAVISLHLDGNWERDLEYFRELPKGKAVFETDGATNIYKIKEVLGDRMCIKGDVPAAKLTLGTPDEVYNYSTRLIKDMGTGFILSSGCTVPPNAKIENVKAMIAAATGK